MRIPDVRDIAAVAPVIPLDKPEERHRGILPWATIRERTPRQYSRRLAVIANAVKPKASTAYGCHTLSTMQLSMTTTIMTVGGRSCRWSCSRVELRHGSAGPTPIRSTSVAQIGTVIELKKGAPTLTFTPRIASATSGKSVPSRTVNMKPQRSRLLNRNTVSRLAMASSCPVLLSDVLRPASRTPEPTRTTAMKPRNQKPTVPSAKACTELRMPERVRKVPRIVSAKVATMSVMFHTRASRAALRRSPNAGRPWR